MDIGVCHRLLVKRNAANVSKWVIVKFVNREHAKSILSKKFPLSSTNFSRLNINDKLYFNLSLCQYYCYLWRRCKDLQRKEMIHHTFLSEQTLPWKIFHESDVRYSKSDSTAKWQKNIFYLYWEWIKDPRNYLVGSYFFEIMAWDLYYYPRGNYLRYFQGPTDPLPYTIVHTVFVNLFLANLFKNFDKVNAQLVYLASATISLFKNP